MSDEKVTIGDDEFVAVFLGKEQEVNSEFAQHTRIQWIRAVGRPTPDILNDIPLKTKAYILTEGIPHAIYTSVTEQARRVHVTYLNRKNHRAVRGTLYEFFPRENGNGPTPSIGDTRGKLKTLFEKYPPDLSKGSAEEARRLQGLAREMGIVTTHGSLAQAIAVLKRKAGRGDIPASVRTKNPTQEALQTLDDAIAGLQLMRDWIIKTERENLEMVESLATIKKVFKIQ